MELRIIRCYIKEPGSEFCSQLSHVLIITASSNHRQCQKYFIDLQCYLVSSLNPTPCDHYLQESLVSAFIFLLISAAYKYLIMPHPACSHLTPKADSSALAHRLKLQSNKRIKHCSISQQSGKIHNSSLGKVVSVLEHNAHLSLHSLKPGFVFQRYIRKEGKLDSSLYPT